MRRDVRNMFLLALVALWGLCAFALTWYGQRAAGPDARWDAIVVLGARVSANGRPSVALAQRIEKAIELHRRGVAPKVIFTGGIGDTGFQESAVSASYAHARGVPKAAILTEGRSTSTAQNAQFAAELGSFRRVLIVSDDYHVFRAERVFSRYFEVVRGTGTTNPYRWPRIKGALREVFAVLGYAVTGRLHQPST